MFIPQNQVISLGPDCSLLHIKRVAYEKYRCASPLENVWLFDPFMPVCSPVFGGPQVVATLIKNDFRGLVEDLELSYRGRVRSSVYPIEFSHYREEESFESVRKRYQALITQFIQNMETLTNAVFLFALRLDHCPPEFPFIKTYVTMHTKALQYLISVIKSRYPSLKTFKVVHITYVQGGCPLHDKYAQALKKELVAVSSCVPDWLVVPPNSYVRPQDYLEKGHPMDKDWRRLAQHLKTRIQP